MLPPNATATAQSPPATATPTTPDYDIDGNGLIEVDTLTRLNAIRYDLDGDGLQGSVNAANWATYTTAFSNAPTGMGCPSTGCTGYELTQPLNFDNNGDDKVDSEDLYPDWTPIGTDAHPFSATFKGKVDSNDVMPTISNLTITSAATRVGLFGVTHENASIESVGLVDVNINIFTSSGAAVYVGALVGENKGDITACYSTGKIKAAAVHQSRAGGLVGSVSDADATVATSFSRATVEMYIHTDVTGDKDIHAGGLVGHNSGTLTDTYAAGAVKGIGNGGAVGGLVGNNTKTIAASYSIAPVTAAKHASTDSQAPTVGGLIGRNTSSATVPVTASYWDYISSGIDVDTASDSALKKSTYDLTSPTISPTNANPGGIYATWDTMKWDFSDARFHPILTHGGHTATIKGNQLFVNGGVGSRYGRNEVHPREGMTLRSNLGAYGQAFRGMRAGLWQWETSDDGISWTTIPLTYRHGTRTSSYDFVLRPLEDIRHVGKYFRAKTPLRDDAGGGYAYTRVIGKVKAAASRTTGSTSPTPLSFDSGNSPAPRVGTAITVALPDGARDATGLWYRCARKTDALPACELVGSRESYIPGAADLGKFIRAIIYYKDENTSNRWTRANTTAPTEEVADIQRRDSNSPWRNY